MLRRFAVLVVAVMGTLVLIGASARSVSAISLGLQWTGNYGQTETEMGLVGKSGTNLFRLHISPAASGYGSNWNYYDKVFAEAAKNGVTILPHFEGRMNNGAGYPTAAEQSSWSEWAKQAVRRYGYKGVYWSTHPEVPAKPVIAWEMLNEPNNPGFYSVNATKYGEFLAWAGSAVQAASESWGEQKTGVLFGGLLAWSSGTSYQTFLKNAYNVSGAAAAVTGVAIHPYELDPAGFPGKTRIQAFKEHVTGARAFLNGLSGGSGKSLWITETGWPAEAEYAVGEVEQAKLLTESFEWAKASSGSLNLHAIVWYNFRDALPSTWQSRSGLVDGNGEFREAWSAFQQQTGAAAWPTLSWHYEYMGPSEIKGDPDVSSPVAGSLNLYARGLDDKLWQRWAVSGPWSGWQQISAGAISSGPGAVSWGPGRVDTFARNADGSVGHWYYNGSAWYYEPMGSTPEILGDPDVASPTAGSLNLFVRGLDGKLWQKWAVSGPWSGWQQISAGAIASSPAAVSWGPNRVDVVARMPDNSLGHWYYFGSGWYYDNLGGEFTADPDIASTGEQKLNVIVRGLDKNLWQKRFTPTGGWGAWEFIGGPVASGPGAVSWGPSRVEVFARMEDNTVGHWYYSP
jgi:hypothetical protein